MKRTRIPGLIDVVKVNDADEIRALVRSNQVDRRYDGRWPLMNGLLLRQDNRGIEFSTPSFPDNACHEKMLTGSIGKTIFGKS